MLKYATLAALFGFASTAQVMEWSETDSIIENEWLNVDWRARFDVTWGTLYRAEGPVKTTAPFDREEYGAFTESKARLYIEGDWAKVRQFNFQFRLVPFYFEPYVQCLDYYRSEDEVNNGPALKTVGYRDLSLMEFSTKRLKNIKTFIKSVYDYVDEPDTNDLFPEDTEWGWDEDNEADYKDPYYSWNILEELDEDIATKSWYGKQTWYDEVTIYEY